MWSPPSSRGSAVLLDAVIIRVEAVTIPEGETEGRVEIGCSISGKTRVSTVVRRDWLAPLSYRNTPRTQSNPLLFSFQDKDSKFRLILIESRIHRLARYYRLAKMIPSNFKYESANAAAMVV